MRSFAGQVLLIVNTASKCGFTPQYRGLEDLHRDLSPRGFSGHAYQRTSVSAASALTAP